MFNEFELNNYLKIEILNLWMEERMENNPYIYSLWHDM